MKQVALLLLCMVSSDALAAAKGTQFWNLAATTVTHLQLAPAGTTGFGPDQCENDPDGTVDPYERVKVTGVEVRHLRREGFLQGREDLHREERGGRERQGLLDRAEGAYGLHQVSGTAARGETPAPNPPRSVERAASAPRVGTLLAAVVALIAGSLAVAAARPARAAEPRTLDITFLAHKIAPQPSYELDVPPLDEGLAGVRLAVQDNNTTTFLTGLSTHLAEAVLDPKQSPVEAARASVEHGARVIVADLPADELLAVADALKDSGAVVLNAGAADDRLRGADCRADLFHVTPSRAMLTDALAQFLAFKRWPKVFLVVGPHAEDRLYADAFRHAADKFNLSVVAERPWTFGPLARARANSPVEADALVFTRDVDADVIVVADEANDFGDYVPYHTWNPRLVAGTQGLVATTWHPAQQAWAATQLQNRFAKLAGRPMRPLDYQAWAAVRAAGEAALRAKTTDPKAIAAFMAGSQFQLAAFKGVPETFRAWDHQLRQPILIAQPRAVVSVSPQAGYLHERTTLDTLGVDEPETACHF